MTGLCHEISRRRAETLGPGQARVFGHQILKNIMAGKGCTLDSAYWICSTFPDITYPELHAEAYPHKHPATE